MAEIVKIGNITINWDNVQFAEFNKDKNIITIVGMGWSMIFASQLNPIQKVGIRLIAEKFDMLKEWILEKQKGYRVI